MHWQTCELPKSQQSSCSTSCLPNSQLTNQQHHDNSEKLKQHKRIKRVKLLQQTLCLPNSQLTNQQHFHCDECDKNGYPRNVGALRHVSSKLYIGINAPNLKNWEQVCCNASSRKELLSELTKLKS